MVAAIVNTFRAVGYGVIGGVIGATTYGMASGNYGHGAIAGLIFAVLAAMVGFTRKN